jgi:DNA-binding response OmpR family regulator
MTGEKILIVEDERAVARGLEYGLRDAGFEVAWAETGARGLALAASWQPHLLILDIRLPDISGYDVCRRLRQEGHRQPVLMLTARDEEVDKILGLELGADDYVVKPYSLRELISRIRSLIRRTYGEFATTTGPTLITVGDLQIDLDRMWVHRQGMPVDLTPTEFRLLRHLVTHANRPISRDALIEAVWGYDGDLGNDRTIDVHIRHLRQKLEDDPAAPRYLLTVRSVGYKFQMA